VWATSRHADKRERALARGAHATFESGARLPEKVDAVMETVGAATWSHSQRSLKPGGTLVVAGATSGNDPSADLAQVFFLQRSVVGSTMGTRAELERLITFCDAAGVKPLIDSTRPLAEARAGFARMADGELFGKVVFTS
jgi:D-arabinose 1-dehydrogenase-like Zn-dependent alcohol dehydrogenase